MDFGVKDEAPTCKGVVGRYHEQTFTSKNALVHHQRHVTLLKKKSCTGCVECCWVYDILGEFPEATIFAAGLKDKDVVQISVVCNSEDWETGQVDDCCAHVSLFVDA